DKAADFCRRAAEMGSDIALMPEMFSIGYTRFDAKKPGAREDFWTWAVPKEGPSIQRFAKLAKELEMAIGVTYLKKSDELPQNAITLFDRHGEELLTYCKVHTSDFKPLEASMTPGEDFYVGTLDTKSGPVQVGAMICFDREQPESARILMLKGAEVIVTPNACGLDDLRLDQFKVRAWENVVDVAMANYPVPNNNGRSAAYNSDGDTVALAGEEEGIFLAEFDLDRLRQNRRKRIWGNAYRRPHRYDILTSQESETVWDRIDGNGKPYMKNER
ncbi:MAG: carbon-nitrogen hydrolase family protein, partial [Candidatus Omnitrophica bacterium]|nr:carbon-nitrogen hydrolase family protein [Candidatus Omnitrophota bacterium]